MSGFTVGYMPYSSCSIDADDEYEDYYDDDDDEVFEVNDKFVKSNSTFIGLATRSVTTSTKDMVPRIQITTASVRRS